MKRIICAVLLFIMSFSVSAFAQASQLKVYIDGVEVKFDGAKPYMDQEGKLQLPIEKVDEIFWCKVSYDEKEQMNIIEKDKTRIRFQDTGDKYYIGEIEVKVEEPLAEAEPNAVGTQTGDKTETTIAQSPVKEETEIKIDQLLVKGYFPAEYLADLFNAEIKFKEAENRIDIIGRIYSLKYDINVLELTEVDIKNISEYASKYPSYFLDSKLLSYERILGSAMDEVTAKEIVLERFLEVNVRPTSCFLIVENEKYYVFQFNWNFYSEGSDTPINYSANVVITKDGFYDFPSKTFTDLKHENIRELLNLMFYVETYDDAGTKVVKSVLSYDKDSYYQRIYYIETVFGDEGVNDVISFNKRTYTVDRVSGEVVGVKKEVIFENVLNKENDVDTDDVVANNVNSSIAV